MTRSQTELPSAPEAIEDQPLGGGPLRTVSLFGDTLRVMAFEVPGVSPSHPQIHPKTGRRIVRGEKHGALRPPPR